MDTNIPKIVHYCWFGGKKIPAKYNRYIEGWKKILPEYTFILWNEDNFDVNCTNYSKQAYQEGKYAFVSDVARVYALNSMGGIYLDTDVEMIRSPEPLFKEYSVILGTENVAEGTIGTGFIASIAHSSLLKKMIKYYDKHEFLQDNGQLDLLANTTIIADILRTDFNLRGNDKIQNNDDIVIYPKEFFTAFDNNICKADITSNTYCVHHFSDSWSTTKGKIKRRVKMIINRLILGLKDALQDSRTKSK